jgi:hypothetical protein
LAADSRHVIATASLPVAMAAAAACSAASADSRFCIAWILHTSRLSVEEEDRESSQPITGLE